MNITASDHRLLTRREAAHRLNCSIKTLDRKISSGDLPTVRIGRMIRIRPEDLAVFITHRRFS